MAKRITHLDVLGEVRRAQRILRRVEKWLVQEERAARRRGEKEQARRETQRKADALELAGQP